MIVREHQALAAALNHGFHDLGQREIDVRRITIEAFQIETVGALIDMGNPQAFACWVAPSEAITEKLARSSGPVESVSIR